jgi:hypothetical protein
MREDTTPDPDRGIPPWIVVLGKIWEEAAGDGWEFAQIAASSIVEDERIKGEAALDLLGDAWAGGEAAWAALQAKEPSLRRYAHGDGPRCIAWMRGFIDGMAMVKAATHRLPQGRNRS